MNLADFVRRKRSALLIATGPNRVLAPAWRPHFDVVATYHQSCLDYQGIIDFGTFVDWQLALSCTAGFSRIQTFLCPENLLSLHDQNDRRSLEEVYIPRERAVTFPVNLMRAGRDRADECVQSGELFWPWYGVPATLHILAMLGYQSIFCLGCSDMEGQVGEAYRQARYLNEVTADAIAERFGCRVSFWCPGMTPEGWRTDTRRGFVMTR